MSTEIGLVYSDSYPLRVQINLKSLSLYITSKPPIVADDQSFLISRELSSLGWTMASAMAAASGLSEEVLERLASDPMSCVERVARYARLLWLSSADIVPMTVCVLILLTHYPV